MNTGSRDEREMLANIGRIASALERLAAAQEVANHHNLVLLAWEGKVDPLAKWAAALLDEEQAVREGRVDAEANPRPEG